MPVRRRVARSRKRRCSRAAVRLLVVDDDVAICRQMAAGLATRGISGRHRERRARARSRRRGDAAGCRDRRSRDAEHRRARGDPHGSSSCSATPSTSIVLTGHDDEQRRADAFEAGADDFVVKPVAMTELRRRVSRRDAHAARVRRTCGSKRRPPSAAWSTARRPARCSRTISTTASRCRLNNLAYLVDVVKGDAEVTDALAATLRSLRRMSGLVANFVDIARFEDAAVKPMVARDQRPRAPRIGDRGPLDVARARRDLRDRLCARARGPVRRAAGRARAPQPGRQRGALLRNRRQRSGSARSRGTSPPTARSRSGSSNTGPQIPENIRRHAVRQVRPGQRRQARHGPLLLPTRGRSTWWKDRLRGRPDGPSFVLRLPGRA